MESNSLPNKDKLVLVALVNTKLVMLLVPILADTTEVSPVKERLSVDIEPLPEDTGI